jgi:hypothetical protein
MSTRWQSYFEKTHSVGVDLRSMRKRSRSRLDWRRVVRGATEGWPTSNVAGNVEVNYLLDVVHRG